MAVTGAIFNSLSFGGVSSADYGIYITGEAVFNAPKRAVETVSVPGRNGDIIIDQGHWENIEIKYPAGTFGMDETQFKTALSNFRNAIVSQLGYQRLSDTYHPDEYRMGIYVEGLEVDTKSHNKAGQFNLVFNCKPQRWLTEGETAVTVESGDTLTNPTPYDAGPLLIVEGYGTISFNDYDIELEDKMLGNITLADEITYTAGGGSRSMRKNVLNEGDEITFGGVRSTITVTLKKGYDYNAGSFSISDSNTAFTSSYFWNGTGRTVKIITELTPRTFQYVPTTRVWENTATFHVTAGSGVDITVLITTKININTTSWYISATRSKSSPLAAEVTFDNYNVGAVTAESTKKVLGHPTYIDCEIGEVYLIRGGRAESLNQYISLGSELPVLKSGDNEITIDDTITELKVKPKWWKL